jgi:hypothetical protein
VAVGTHAVPGAFDLAVRAHEERGTDDALDQLAVEHLLAEGAVLGHDRLVGIAQQIELQSELLAKRDVRRGVVG